MVVVLSSVSRSPASSKTQANKQHLMVSAGQQQQQQLKSARLLWLGDSQVGKSASIVRYTTGRFIGEYSGASSNDWLYYKLPAPNSKQQSLVELLEQRDIEFSNWGNFFAHSPTAAAAGEHDYKRTNHQTATVGTSSTSADQQTTTTTVGRSALSSRVALDQQLDQEIHEKQQMLERLRWADAYIVLYSISDANSFNKAIKYLNLIANNINSFAEQQQHQQQQISPASNNSRSSPQQPSSPATGSASSSNSSTSKRPILLLGNKLDLERGGRRQVQLSDGRHLAIRHQSMFAEISVAQTGRQLEQLLASLLQLIEPANLHAASWNLHQQFSQQHAGLEHLITSCTSHQATAQQQLQQQPRRCSAPLIGLWRARNSPELHHLQPVGAQYTLPARASLVRSQPVCAVGGLAQSCRILVSKPEQASAVALATTPRAKSGSLESINGHQAAAQSSNNKGRYENFKSSFRKASMAIVRSRALTGAKKVALEPLGGASGGGKPLATTMLAGSDSPIPDVAATTTTTTGARKTSGGDQIANSVKESLKQLQQQQRRRILTSQPSSSSSTGSSSVSTVSNSTAWLRNHMRLSRGKTPGASSELVMKPLAADSAATLEGRPSAAGETLSERIKRPLLKYKNRRKTVAFEQINSQTMPEASSTSLSASATAADGGAATTSGLDQSARKGSLASHSSLLFSIASTSEDTGNSGSGSGSYSTARQSGGHSSCSLSTSDTYHSSLLALLGANNGSGAAELPNRAPSSVGSISVCSSNCSPINTSRASSGSSGSQQLEKSMPTLITNGNTIAAAAAATSNNNRKLNYSKLTTLSRNSTSAGSYSDELSADELQVYRRTMDAASAALPPNDGRQVAASYVVHRVDPQIATVCNYSGGTPSKNRIESNTMASCSSLANRSSNNCSVTTTPKKRYQLVKSVQNTLTNLTRSSNVDNGQAVAKRSLCTGLFKGSARSEIPANIKPLVKATPLVEQNLAKTEQVHVMPMFVGYCK